MCDVTNRSSLEVRRLAEATNTTKLNALSFNIERDSISPMWQLCPKDYERGQMHRQHVDLPYVLLFQADLPLSSDAEFLSSSLNSVSACRQ
jgi:hypothetical protein